MKEHHNRTIFFVLTFLLYAVQGIAGEPSYNPLAISAGFAPQIIDLTVHDSEREREIPLRIYLPAEKTPVPIVLFSHGLGGSREQCVYLGHHWAGRGYVAVFVQHPGSDVSVWRDKPFAERLTTLKQAANAENFLHRINDIHVVLDVLERWNADPNSPFAGRLDVAAIGMSGHSFGAITTQAVSGQQFPIGQKIATEPRIHAAIMFSPSSPRRGDLKRAFGKVNIPWMLMTGTNDVSAINDTDVASRLAVFPALPPGDKYEVVLYGAEHSAFTDRALPGEAEARNPNHHRVILALSAAFWDAYLRGNMAAKAWLQGDEARSVMEEQDRWQTK
ncbi:hypothetical protein U14_04426 [Candidatus Moduliflexus flocculans]|uniref:Platelet-activating factor acetylhydrolase plasma/intracellular n=1 Tax=Candidatus Moduliflexus flocculans TaxID=1499966 RepID=A0A0S6W656_9BACT|nr:hypothetical protein U14_04426 [Candidatus Moduliflexus flocculans]